MAEGNKIRLFGELVSDDCLAALAEEEPRQVLRSLSPDRVGETDCRTMLRNPSSMSLITAIILSCRASRAPKYAA